MVEQPPHDVDAPSITPDEFAARAERAVARDETFALALLDGQLPFILEWAQQHDDLPQNVEALEYALSRADRGLVSVAHLPQRHWDSLLAYLHRLGYTIGRIPTVEVKSHTGGGRRGAVFMLGPLR